MLVPTLSPVVLQFSKNLPVAVHDGFPGAEASTRSMPRWLRPSVAPSSPGGTGASTVITWGGPCRREGTSWLKDDLQGIAAFGCGEGVGRRSQWESMTDDSAEVHPSGVDNPGRAQTVAGAASRRPCNQQFLVVHQVRVEGNAGSILWESAEEEDSATHSGQIQRRF